MPLYNVTIQYRVHGRKTHTTTAKVHAKSKQEAARKIERINRQWEKGKRVRRLGLTATVTKVTPIRAAKRKRGRKRIRNRSILSLLF